MYFQSSLTPLIIVGDEVYLAPDGLEKRIAKDWLFLGFYNEQLQAICPAQHKESCYSTVNTANDWAGIKLFHTSPAPEFAYNDEREAKLKRVWYGREETAFGRHTDTIAPLLYQVPNDAALKNEANDLTRAQRRKNREKPFCLLDCKGTTNQIKFNGKTAP